MAKDYRQIEGMIKQMDECLHHAYDRGYNKGIADGNINDGTFAEKVNEAYENGLRDAWNCSAKLFGYMNEMDIAKVFPQEWKQGGYWELMKLDPKDAIERVRAFEEKKELEIRVGDEVYSETFDEKGVVTKVLDSDVIFLCSNSSMLRTSKNKVKKTGKHYDGIESILDQMRAKE